VAACGERSVDGEDVTATSNVAEGEDLVRAHRIYTRRTEARELREEAAELAFLRPHLDHVSNGEEAQYRRPLPPPPPAKNPENNGELSYIANYSKGLPHNHLGEVNQRDYRSLLRALYSGNPDHFEHIPLGPPCPPPPPPEPLRKRLKLTNPQAGLAFDLEGPDAQAVTLPPAPRIDSRQNSAEMGELYWMALLRDVPFTNYGPANVQVAAAATSLTNEFTDFRGPKVGGAVTPGTLFRGFTPGDLAGPYVSQFLLKGTIDPVLNPGPNDAGVIRYGTLPISQRQKTALPTTAADTRDYLIDFDQWLCVQNGEDRRGTDQFDPDRRFIRNLRDLATYVHFDALYEAYLNACLILLNMPARVDPGNPYLDSRTQEGFGTFGPPHILTLVTEVATRALKAVWFQKWFVHRRLRPEEFGGRIEVHRTPGGMAPGRYPMIDGQILASTALTRVINRFGTALLPQAFPEGAPTHPAYGAGHATVSGACVTILKAWFDESDVFDPGIVDLPLTHPKRAELRENRTPKVPNAAGDTLVDLAPLPNPPLTVGGELNKLAANISLGRNGAGVHWRSDYTESVRLGEEIAIRILQEQKPTYNEDHYFSLTKFDGTAITI
jgi:hypothetical protein